MIRGILIAGFFASCHGMTADKAFRKPQFGYSLMDLPFDASHICQDAVGTDGFLQPGKALQIVINGGAQKNIIAQGKAAVPFGTGDVHDSVEYCIIQYFLCPVVGKNLPVRMKFPNRFCYGASDQPQSDKTNGGGFHVFQCSFLFSLMSSK